MYILVLRMENWYPYEKIINCRILQHFATELCNFTNFGMFFNAVIMNCTISKFLKILFWILLYKTQESLVNKIF